MDKRCQSKISGTQSGKEEKMKPKLLFKIPLLFIAFIICIVSCKERKPKGDEFAWSPDGKKLAVTTIKSEELLLIDIEKERIGDVKSIASCRQDTSKFYAPNWSYDGQFLLYSKSNEKFFNSFVYSILDTTTIDIVNQPLASKKDFERIVFPQWSPIENRILIASLHDANIYRMVSVAPDGGDKKLLNEIIGEHVVPQWSPDGQWIAYSLHVRNGHDRNGLWKMKKDGGDPKQIYRASQITRFQWSPDGAQIGLIAVNETNDTSEHQFSIIDGDGNNERVILKGQFEINEFTWSPDGEKSAFVQTNDSLKNIWLVELATLTKVKLTFDNVKDFFGWGHPEQLFYTIELPKDLVELTQFDKERREFSDIIRGIGGTNQLISSNQFMKTKVEKNVYALTYCGSNNCAAYFKLLASDLFELTSYYCPAIRFANDEIIYLPRTKAEHIAVANECYLNQKYEEALVHLGHYWDINFDSDEFRINFDVDSSLSRMTIHGDSSQMNLLLKEFNSDGLTNGAIIKTYLTLRQLDQAEKAHWLFEQFNKLCSYYMQNQGRSQNNMDNLFWTIVSTYGRYLELESGINDGEMMLTLAEQDSLFKTNILFAQVILAFENGQNDLALEKFKASLKIIPEKIAESGNKKGVLWLQLGDIKDLLSLFLRNSTAKHESMISSIWQEITQRFSGSEELMQVYELFGDFYHRIGKPTQAFEAYQTIVTKDSNTHEVWQKIFELEIR